MEDRSAAVSRLYEGLLKRQSVGPDDRFFDDLGGHSLLAAELVKRINEMFGAKLSLRHVYQVQTPAGIAALLPAS
jgi:acyl carrier protein